jgi:DNA-binding protein HU-beta
MATKNAAAKTAVKEKTQNEILSELAEKTGLPKAKVKEVLEAHTALVTSELQTAGSFSLAGIGKLKIGDRAERKGRNPSTGAEITIPASKSVKFSAGKAFKENCK